MNPPSPLLPPSFFFRLPSHTLVATTVPPPVPPPRPPPPENHVTPQENPLVSPLLVSVMNI